VIAIPTVDDVDGIADQQSVELYRIRLRRAGWLQQACMAGAVAGRAAYADLILCGVQPVVAADSVVSAMR